MGQRIAGLVIIAVVMACPGWASAEEAPGYDLSLSGFFGFAMPLAADINQTNATQNTNFTAKDVKLDSGGSYGVKLTAWTTALRAKNGFDLGLEIDHTRFSADPRAQTTGATGVNQGSPVSSAFVRKNDLWVRTIAVNALFRIPFGVTETLPHGRWYPYLGVGGGVQRASMRLSDGSEDSNTALLVQGLGGVKVFLIRHVAIFGEYKYTHGDHSFVFDTTRNLVVQAHHFTFGLALHF